MKSVIGLASVVVAMVAAFVLLATAPPSTQRAEAAIDMTGIWSILLDFQGSSCPYEFGQTGSALVVTVLCEGGGVFTGSIDKATGQFTLTGGFSGVPGKVTIDGSTDGSTASGTYSHPFQSGTFTGDRKPEGIKPAFSLSAYGPNVLCDGVTSVADGDVFRPDKCDVPVGGSFTVETNVIGYPQPAYEAFRTYLRFGSDLIYKQQAEVLDELIWAECTFPARISGAVFVVHSCPSNIFFSTFIGTVVKLQFNCTTAVSSSNVELLPLDDPAAGQNGTRFSDFASNDVIPHIDSLGINCVDLPKLPYPGDTDGDGCSDLDEHRSAFQAHQGGGRDHLNPYDFYDVLGAGGGPPDGLVDLPNDILGVIQRFSPQGQPPYDIAFDRGPSAGPHPWNMTAPDGAIDLPNDILGVIQQFGHSCAG